MAQGKWALAQDSGFFYLLIKLQAGRLLRKVVVSCFTMLPKRKGDQKQQSMRNEMQKTEKNTKLFIMFLPGKSAFAL